MSNVSFILILLRAPNLLRKNASNFFIKKHSSQRLTRSYISIFTGSFYMYFSKYSKNLSLISFIKNILSHEYKILRNSLKNIFFLRGRFTDELNRKYVIKSLNYYGTRFLLSGFYNNRMIGFDFDFL